MPVITEADGKGGLKAAQPSQQGDGKKDGKSVETSSNSHLRGPGPVMTDKLPEKATDEELKQRFKELNQEEPQSK